MSNEMNIGNWANSFNLHDHDVKFSCFEQTVTNFKDRILKKLEDHFQAKENVKSGKVSQNHDDELKDLEDEIKILRNKVDAKVEELAQQQLRYDNYKKDKNTISQEIKDTHEAFLMSKKYYKKVLQMYHTIESSNGETQNIFLQFFTEKRDGENFSVRLLRTSKTGHYQLLGTTPQLSNFQDYQRKLQETNNIPGALCSIRQAFIDMKLSKKSRKSKSAVAHRQVLKEKACKRTGHYTTRNASSHFDPLRNPSSK